MGTREKILAAAAEAFSLTGFKRTTTRDIARRAGVNHACVHYYFSHKDCLYREVMSYLFETNKDKARTVLPAPETGDPWALIYAWALKMIRFMVEQDPYIRWEHKIIFREMVEPTAHLRHFYETYIKPTVESLKAVLRSAASPSVGEDEIVARTAVVLSQCAFFEQNRAFVELMASKDFYSEENYCRLARQIAENALRGLEGGAEKGPIRCGV